MMDEPFWQDVFTPSALSDACERRVGWHMKAQNLGVKRIYPMTTDIDWYIFTDVQRRCFIRPSFCGAYGIQ